MDTSFVTFVGQNMESVTASKATRTIMAQRIKTVTMIALWSSQKMTKTRNLNYRDR